MATFTELCNDVYTITKRPDLVDDTKLAVKAATLKLHQSDFYQKDIFETSINFSSLDYIQQLDVYTLFPRFRALKYFRRYDSSGTGSAKEFFKVLSPVELVDDYGIDKTNVCYLAGSVLNIRSKTAFDTALIGLYQNPVIDELTYSSWVAVGHPYAIVFDAARLLFKQIGFDEQSAMYEKLVAEQIAEIRASNILAEGY